MRRCVIVSNMKDTDQPVNDGRCPCPFCTPESFLPRPFPPRYYVNSEDDE